MEHSILILAVVAVLVVWWRSLYRGSGGRIWSPLWLAFTTTALAVVFVVSGSIGYRLDKRTRFFAGTAWSDTVIWWEVAVGLAVVPIAVFFWRKGLRDLSRRPGRT